MDHKALPYYFLLVLLVLSFGMTLTIFWPFIAALALALIFTVILQPLYDSIRAYIPRHTGVASVLTVFAGIIGILLPLGILAVLLVQQAESLYITLTQGSVREYLQVPVSNAEALIQRFVPGAHLIDISPDLDTYARRGLEWIIQHMGTAFTTAAAFLINFFVFFFSLYYLLRDGHELKRQLVVFSPLPDGQDEAILDRLELAVNSVIKGSLTIALIQGVVTAIGFTLFGVPNGILWGTVAAMGALIPGVGTSLVFLPTVLILFFTGNVFSAIGLTVWGMFAVGLIDNFLGPRLIGGRMHMHPLFILLAVLGGLALFGPLGIFLGPLSVSFFLAILSLYADISKKGAR